jgi:hypothetical protein
MNNPIHILVTVRKTELLPAATLVFKTLRVGFPTSPIFVWGNGLPMFLEDQVRAAARPTGATFNNLKPTCHDHWIEQLVLNQAQPFWICDTDMVFFDECEWFFDGRDSDLFAGRFEPTWHEPWTDSVHVERLHTCLQWFNPVALRAAMAGWLHSTVPQVFANAEMPLIRQHFVPVRGGKTLFYDSTAGLWHAGGGTKFTARQNGAFEHLHCGSYSDEVGKVDVLKGLPAMHEAIIQNPELARGIQKQQDEFYKRRQITKRKEKL